MVSVEENLHCTQRILPQTAPPPPNVAQDFGGSGVDFGMGEEGGGGGGGGGERERGQGEG
eukprot:398394-Rhodomonas_salina.1